MSKNSHLSENEDDPDVYESSGDEWNSVEETKSNRRSSRRLSKKPRITVAEPESTDEEDSDSEPRKRKSSKNGVNKKKQKVAKKDEDCSSSDNSKTSTGKTSTNSESKVAISIVPTARGIHRKFMPKTIFSEDYSTGSFVILKKDAQVGDPSKHACIWRIDGKALLQKYEAFDDEGKVRHKNTSIYTGWSPMDKDLYAPVTVDVVHHNNQNLTVELHWDKLKDIIVDSD
ncbi:uncharacterized protein [Leptinotarsa decemlineata]|uniref:uncharacterized protein n=1 Tax=Leptinotarsa decemlineata TaxID=7539 RepID=UPI000C2539BB|nr:uncharacterized protein LOC111504853 [Leptinotarsa decemlineata]XP_023015331.1 uncharacterized protein LOC111504853 [Leptinotarsa decemlineata]